MCFVEALDLPCQVMGRVLSFQTKILLEEVLMITKETVNNIASLARLHINDEENARFLKNLEDILHYVEKLNRLDVTGVLPTSHVLSLENVFRDDVVLPSLTQAEALSFAIDSRIGHYKVPKVIE